jgi:hypothetical protein
MDQMKTLKLSAKQRLPDPSDGTPAEYRVLWEIDITAESPVDAAIQALKVQRNPDSDALVFEVRSKGKSLLLDLLDVPEYHDQAEPEPSWARVQEALFKAAAALESAKAMALGLGDFPRHKALEDAYQEVHGNIAQLRELV